MYTWGTLGTGYLLALLGLKTNKQTNSTLVGVSTFVETKYLDYVGLCMPSFLNFLEWQCSVWWVSFKWNSSRGICTGVLDLKGESLDVCFFMSFKKKKIKFSCRVQWFLLYHQIVQQSLLIPEHFHNLKKKPVSRYSRTLVARSLLFCLWVCLFLTFW